MSKLVMGRGMDDSGAAATASGPRGFNVTKSWVRQQSSTTRLQSRFEQVLRCEYVNCSLPEVNIYNAAREEVVIAR